jgi:acyl-CoA thioesterase
MTLHPFDAAMALQPQPDGSFAGTTSADYWNMLGPYGGITAAVALQSVMQHPDRLGEPIALTVNYAAPMAAGAFEARAVAVRTNRSTQHWTVTLSQRDEQGVPQVGTTATVVTAVRRDTWSASDAQMPAAPAPQTLPRAIRPGKKVAWLDRYEIRSISGGLPSRWDGQGEHSLSELWMRDDPPRPLDFSALAALADLFFPRIWLRRATLVPVGTVSMTVYFHANAAQLAESGTGYLLGQARGQGFRHGFFDHSGLLWNAQGVLLASTHQIVYYKQ